MYIFIKQYKSLYFLVLLCIFLYSIIDIGKSILISIIFDSEQLFLSMSSIIQYVALFLFIYLVMMILQQYLVEILKNKIRNHLNRKLYLSYATLHIEEFNNYDSNMIINEFQNEINLIIDQYVSSKLNIFSLVILFILGSVYIGFLSSYILIFLYICACITLLFNNVFSKRLSRNQRVLLDVQKNWIKVVRNFCTNFKIMKNYQLEEEFITVLDQTNKKLEKTMIKFNGFMKVLSAFNGGISQIMFFGTIVFGLVLIDYDMLTIGKLIGIIQTSNMIIHPIYNYANLRNNIQATKHILIRLNNKVSCRKEKEKNIIKDYIESIELHHLSFQYNQKEVLKNINFRFEKGKKYLIVGESGCGKSTLLEIIAKQKECPGIKINGLELSKIDFSSYMQYVTYLTQNHYILPFNLKKNIILQKAYDKEKFAYLFHKLKLDKFLNQLDMHFNEDAYEMSGGELQRINFARALYHKKDWLLLDEAFSAVDEQTMISLEKFILENDDLSVIAISHKLVPEIVKLYDVILKVSNGELYSYSAEEFLHENKNMI